MTFRINERGVPIRSTIAVLVLVLVQLTSVSVGTVPAQTPSTDTDETDQQDLFDVAAALFGRDRAGVEEDEKTNDDRRLFVFPSFGGNPAQGVSGGALATLTDYWGDPNKTQLSSVLLSGSVTSKKQVLLVARSDIYAPGNGWHFIGDWRYYDYVEQTHGLGGSRPALPAVEVTYDWYRFHQIVTRPIVNDLEFGIGYHLDTHRGIRFPTSVQLPDVGWLSGNFTDDTSSGVSLNLIYDRRDHPLNTERGLLARAEFTMYRTRIGSDADWDNLELEGRVYRRLSGRRRQVVALWGIGSFTRGRAPYFDLPSIGWDLYGRTGRGYRSGRFRGRDWTYTEVEYRVDLLRNGLLGAVLFGNTSQFSDPRNDRQERWASAVGVGLRLKINKETRSNLAVDFAWGRDGSKGVYVAINEAF